MYKYVNSIRFLPPELLTFQSDQSVRRSARNVNNNRSIVIPFTNRERCKNSAFNCCAQVWNAISDEIIVLNFAQFRLAVRKNVFFNNLCDRGIVERIVV